MIVKEKNFVGELKPRIIADEYHNCNFSFKEPIDKDGVKYGHPLDVNAIFVECNLTNRQPHKDSKLIRCNTTIVDTEIVERSLIDHKEEIESSDLTEETKIALLKQDTTESVRTVVRAHKVYGKVDSETKIISYISEVAK